MTELMKQLQQWANDGLYDWENYKFGDLNKESILRASMRYNSGDPKGIGHIKNVLDGTIQVWRPVEHYPPPEKGSDILAIVDGMVLEGSIDDRGLFDDDARYCGVPFTHWQPLPQPPQKGK